LSTMDWMQFLSFRCATWVCTGKMMYFCGRIILGTMT